MSTMLKKDYSKTKPVCKVTFTLPLEAAQGGKEVRILGDFNEWSWEKGYKMKSGKNNFTTEVELASGSEYQFRYLIDNHIWENDWNADNYLPNPFGVYNSVLSLREVAAAATAKAAAAKAAPAPKAAAVKAEAKPDAPKAVAKPAVKAAPAPKAAAVKAEAKPATPKAVAKPAVKAAAAKAAPAPKAAAVKAEAKPAAPKAAAKAAAPKTVAPKAAAAKAAVADDLTKIEGVGPKIAELLKAAGIVTFKDLSAAKATTVKGILDAAGKRFQMHDPATWADQSKLAANGEWEKLAKLQDALKGGKK
jgi:predicted flap endonuclease-1-like 5' DNA nuclease